MAFQLNQILRKQNIKTDVLKWNRIDGYCDSKHFRKEKDRTVVFDISFKCFIYNLYISCRKAEAPFKIPLEQRRSTTTTNK